MSHSVPYPPSANRLWRGRVYKTTEAKNYHWLVRAAIGLDREPISGPISVTLRIYRPRKSGDLDNRIKGCLDALNGVLWNDDDQIVELHAYRFDDKKNPRVEVEVKRVEYD